MIELTPQQVKRLQEIVALGGAPDIDTAIDDAIEARWEFCTQPHPIETPEFLADLERMVEESRQGIGQIRYESKEEAIADIVAGGKKLLAKRESVKA